MSPKTLVPFKWKWHLDTTVWWLGLVIIMQFVIVCKPCQWTELKNIFLKNASPVHTDIVIQILTTRFLLTPFIFTDIHLYLPSPMSQIPLLNVTNIITHLFYLTILVSGSQYDYDHQQMTYSK